ncbi:hypothetical protein ACFPVY_17115 [Flavobacterium qiangtangense]|uniref:Homeodomain phBC6A51-type domain-containing protein n=1 Tax=Flavobacterium qiangtangense TaxID=1442595 RepID=A0ABW1PTD1_9FLAO
MKRIHKKLLKKHKSVLEMINNHCDLYEIYDQFQVTEEDIKFWRKTISEFDKLYLEAVGLTSIQEQFIEVFPKKLLNVSATCKTVKISRQTYYRWRDTCDTFSVFLHDAVEGMKDDVETILLQKLFIDRDSKALYFFMKTKMRDRGYGDSPIYITNNQQNVNAISFDKDYSKYSIEELEAEKALVEGKLLKKNKTSD